MIQLPVTVRRHSVPGLNSPPPGLIDIFFCDSPRQRKDSRAACRVQNRSQSACAGLYRPMVFFAKFSGNFACLCHHITEFWHSVSGWAWRMADHHDADFKAEYAKSSRASCKMCSRLINKDSLRLAIMVQVSHNSRPLKLVNDATASASGSDAQNPLGWAVKPSEESPMPSSGVEDARVDAWTVFWWP